MTRLTLLLLVGCLSGGKGVPTADRPECVAYIDCAATVAPGELDGIIAAYGSTGSCWDERGIDSCEASCAIGRDQLEVFEDAPPACSGDAGPTDPQPGDCEIIDGATTYCTEHAEFLELLQEVGCDAVPADERACVADAIWACDDQTVSQLVEGCAAS